ncbi:MAG: hypothetical protein QG635_66 [Bacteroidota bacterium]|nr:hypothetical protein [Bacteroidota bacterium]
MPGIDGINLPFMPIGGIKELQRGALKNVGSISGDSKFKDILGEELNKLKFSSHASSRIISRDINLSETDMARLETAVSKASDKGASDSLVMLDDKGFIVNIPNRTIITVLPKGGMDSNVITNIDSAVFA